MEKILLYYKFTPLKDPETIRLWQRSLGEQFNLKGRILIAEQGINGTLGGKIADLKSYIKATKSHSAFRDMVFKWSDGSREHFPKLIVKVRPEIVTFNAKDRIKVNENGIVGGGKHLRPQQLHKLIKERGQENVVFFDGRNVHEAAIGHFKGAVVPNVKHTREFVKELKRPQYEKFKSKPVVTYCTGGIRCEVLSALMRQEGFSEVYQLDGGIAKYGERYGDDGLWQGALYVFDDRLSIKFSPQAEDIGNCIHCGGKTSDYVNCANKSCNQLVLVCSNCQTIDYCPDCAKEPATNGSKLIG